MNLSHYHKKSAKLRYRLDAHDIKQGEILFFHYTTSMDYSGIKQITPFNRRFQQAIITLPIPDVHDYK